MGKTDARRRARTQTLTIFLLKEDKGGSRSALQEVDKLSRHRIRVRGRVMGDLYVAGRDPHPPRWLSFVGAYASPPLPRTLLNASTSAVLICDAGKRSFAVTFGQGRHLLDPNAWEEGFGLRVTLNSISDRGVRSVDCKSFDVISRQTRTQVSREGSFADLGFDVEQELLRQVAGHPLDADLGSRLVGIDSLSVTLPLELPDLPAKLVRYLGSYRSDAYKSRFPWADQFREVHDPTRRAELDGTLIERFQTEDFDRLWLAVPEIIEWRDVGGFRYRDSARAELHPDLHIRDFLMAVDVDSVDLPALKRRTVYCIREGTDIAMERWPVYRCLYCEIDEGDSTFVLTDGKWHRIAKGIVREVNTKIQALERDAGLPGYQDASEGAYCERVAAAGATFALMDRQMISYGGGHSSVEFCDLFTKGKQMIHIKRYGASGVLSHLFAQGSVAANLFLTDQDFRKRVNEKLPGTHKITSVSTRPEPSQFEVVFAIVSRSTRSIAESLPFFSRLTLRNAARLLSGFGYKVALTKIAWL